MKTPTGEVSVAAPVIRTRRDAWMVGGLWPTVVTLALLGVTAALLRALFPSDLGTRSEPVRQAVMETFGRDDPFRHQRASEVARFDGRFAAFPSATMLHVIPGGSFLAFAPLQFSRRVRNRARALHRWSGRVLVLAGVVSVLAGFFFGLTRPYAGLAEGVAITVFGSLFLFALCTAVVAIRRGQVARHRAWMIRAFSVAIGISVVRVISLILDLALTPRGVSPQAVFVMSIWSGWLLTFAAAELWVAKSRPA